MKPPLGTALAQQELPQKERPDFMAGYDAGMADAKRMAQQGEQPVCACCGIPAGDVHMSTCQSGKWPSRVSNGDTAAPAPVAQAPFNESDAAMWLTKNKLTMHETLSAAPVAQEPVAMLFGTLPVYDTPEPQAQDKSDNYLSGYCTGRTDLLKEQSAQPVAQITDAAIREIADCIVSNLDSRKGVIDLDLDDDMVEEIMQEMCDTIAHGIREVK